MFKLTIQPLDPIISRDSRPFGLGTGRKMRSLNWLLPSTVCGALRTRLGKIHGSFDIDKLKSVTVKGPFLQCVEALYFPRPLDFVSDGKKGYAIRPQECGEGGTDIPPGLIPAFIQNPPEQDFKPEQLPAFWHASSIKEWLISPENVLSQGAQKIMKNGLSGPQEDERVHVSIKPETGASEDSLLFSTTGLDFRIARDDEILQLKIALEADLPDDYENYLNDLPPLHPLGGERRLAEWCLTGLNACQGESADGWSPPAISDDARCLRMILATPAIFSKGWLPGWISEKDMRGTIPGTKINVCLVSAVVGRWEPVSGWSYERGKRGIKPIRRMVPAGSVYFFETESVPTTTSGSAGLRELWLRSVCDDEQDRRDGFGAALWGIW